MNLALFLILSFKDKLTLLIGVKRFCVLTCDSIIAGDGKALVGTVDWERSGKNAMEYFRNIDRQLLRWAYQRPYENNVLIKALIFIGDGPFWMILVFLSALAGQLFKMPSLIKMSMTLMLGLAICNFFFSLLKSKVNRRRPYANETLQISLGLKIVNRDPGHGAKELESFPSGHVLWTTLCVILLSNLFGTIAVLLFGWLIPTMIFLRPYLGVHYPSDTFAGFILGVTGAAVTLRVLPFLIDVVHGFENTNGYTLGYWCVVGVFLIVGFKSWLKRV